MLHLFSGHFSRICTFFSDEMVQIREGQPVAGQDTAADAALDRQFPSPFNARKYRLNGALAGVGEVGDVLDARTYTSVRCRQFGKRQHHGVGVPPLP